MLGAVWTWIGTLPQGSATFLGTLMGSSLGLIAILIGAFVNAALNRRRDDRLRDHERLALASALYAELVGSQRALRESGESLVSRPVEAGEGFLVPAPAIKLFPEMIPKMGLFDAETIRKVMEAYVLLEQYVGDLVLAGGQLQANMPEGRPMVYLPAERAEFVGEYNLGRANSADEAIEALRAYLKK